MSIFDLSNKTVVITGASGGIGLALVKGFVKASAKVVAADLNPAPVDEAMNGHERVLGLSLDVTDEMAIRAMLSATRARFGPIDALINNAGIKSAETLLDGDGDKIAKTLSVNTDAVLNLTRMVYADSLYERGGRIINIGSSISSRGAIFNYQAGGADYCFSKAIVHDLTRLLAFEAAPQNVTVNAVAPGIIQTPMHERDEEGNQGTARRTHSAWPHRSAGGSRRRDDFPGIRCRVLHHRAGAPCERRHADERLSRP